MIRYWILGTKTDSIIKRFSNISKNNEIGMKFTIQSIGNSFNLISLNGEVIDTFTSKTTIEQYLKSWEALGLITKIRESSFLINTNLWDWNELVKYSLIYILKDSSIEYVASYRWTVIINILVAADVINEFDLSKSITTKKGDVSISKIKEKVVGKFERQIIKNWEIIREIKENYDKQF